MRWGKWPTMPKGAQGELWPILVLATNLEGEVAKLVYTEHATGWEFFSTARCA